MPDKYIFASLSVNYYFNPSYYFPHCFSYLAWKHKIQAQRTELSGETVCKTYVWNWINIAPNTRGVLNSATDTFCHGKCSGNENRLQRSILSYKALNAHLRETDSCVWHLLLEGQSQNVAGKRLRQELRGISEDDNSLRICCKTETYLEMEKTSQVPSPFLWPPQDWSQTFICPQKGNPTKGTSVNQGIANVL